MVTITRKIEWDMGHRVTNHGGLCANLHGHRYAAHFTFGGPLKTESGMPDEGMIIDFSEVKNRLQAIIAELDHGFMIWSGDPLTETLQATKTKIMPVDFIPTAENIAKYLLLCAQLVLPSVQVVNVRVYETPNCYADAQNI